MKLTPLADRVLLKSLEAVETTASGIIISTATKEKSAYSEVVAVGPGGMVDGVDVTMTVKPGMKVIIAKYTGTDVTIDNQDYTLVKQGDILAIVE